MGFTPNVVDGQIILASWGNEIRDRTNQVFASVAERTSQWVSPPNGAWSMTMDTGTLWLRHNGVWKIALVPETAYTPTFKTVAGNVVLGSGSQIVGTWWRMWDHVYVDVYINFGLAGLNLGGQQFGVSCPAPPGPVVGLAPALPLQTYVPKTTGNMLGLAVPSADGWFYLYVHYSGTQNPQVPMMNADNTGQPGTGRPLIAGQYTWDAASGGNLSFEGFYKVAPG